MGFDEMVMVEEESNFACQLMTSRLSRPVDPNHIPVVKLRVFHQDGTYTDMAVTRFEDWEDVRER